MEYQQFLDSCAEYRGQIKVALKRKELVGDIELNLCEYKSELKKKHIHNGLGRGLFLQEAYNIYDPYFDELYKMLSERDKSGGDVKSNMIVERKCGSATLCWKAIYGLYIGRFGGQ